jgi:3-dehydroquinate synthase
MKLDDSVAIVSYVRGLRPGCGSGKSGNLSGLMSTQTLTVDLGDRSYPIEIGAGLLAEGFDLNRYLAGDSCLIVTNETVAPLYLEKLQGCLKDAGVRSTALPDGEAFKTVATVESILDELVTSKAGRDTTVVALGGGVVGDIAGFAAACYMRGVAFIQVPTTLLAQVDSSVGGKTGVNHPGGKNLIGAFHQPEIVLIDTDTLSTLPDRELRAGLAEVIKYGAIIDSDFFAWLESNMSALLERDPAALAYAIRRSCEIKAAIVAEDEREAGKRALLNFGHTFGHAIENTVGYGEWLHGEAVATGMLMAASMSGIDTAERERLAGLVAAAGLPVMPPPVGAAKLREAMKLDKKVKGNQLRFVLLRSLGDAFVTSDYPVDALDEALAVADA